MPKHGQPDYLEKSLEAGLFVRRPAEDYPPGRVGELLSRADLNRGADLATYLVHL